MRDAWLDYARNTLPAPVTGYVARRSVQMGQRVAPGTPLMAIVLLDGVWIDANFKEVQLACMHIGQPVALLATSAMLHSPPTAFFPNHVIWGENW